MVATLLLPGAQAAEAAGEFLVEGVIDLPPNAVLRSDVLGLFLGGTREADPPLEFSEFQIEAPELTLVYYQDSQVAVESDFDSDPSVSPEPTTQTRHTFRNATVTLRGTLLKGYVAINETAPTSSASFISEAPFGVGAVSRSEMTGNTVAAETPRESPSHRQAFTMPHIAARLPGHLEFQGPASLKMYGLTLHVAHAEGQQTFQTGVWTPSRTTPLPVEPIHSNRQAWVVLSGKDIRFTAASPQEWQMAGTDASMEWVGKATFWAVSGEISTPQAKESVRARSISIEGSLGGSISTVEDSGNVRSRLLFQGELGSASGQTVPLQVRSAAGGVPLVLLGMALGVVAGTAGGYLAWRRWGPRPQVEESAIVTPAHAAEYYVGLAEQCIQFEDHARALHWISLAREASPTSVNVVTTTAYVLGELGQFDEALAAYAEASEMDPSDGEADLNAARLAAQAGKGPEVVEPLVLRALERTPECVFDVEDDPEFRSLADRPAFRAALLRAWQRWGRDENTVPP